MMPRHFDAPIFITFRHLFRHYAAEEMCADTADAY